MIRSIAFTTKNAECPALLASLIANNGMRSYITRRSLSFDARNTNLSQGDASQHCAASTFKNKINDSSKAGVSSATSIAVAKARLIVPAMASLACTAGDK